MSQKHIVQNGVFHVTTVAKGRHCWCTKKRVPELLIENLMMTRNLHGAEVFAFCVLPDHMHILMRPGEKGLSVFMHSFKRNSSKDVGFIFNRSGSRTRATGGGCKHIRNTKYIRSRGSATPAFQGWQNGFYDERIRDEKQWNQALQYVQYNPLHHHLVSDIQHWPWSSLHFQDLCDPAGLWIQDAYFST